MAQSTPAPRGTADGRPRAPGMVYLAVFVVVLVLVGAFALTSRQPPPPSIAEFAPQAAEQITDAPTDQSSSSGKGTGEGQCAGPDCGGGLGAPAASSPPPINVPRVRKCVGDPPRQIEDPQSPPCVPYWAGDNGGATSKGVTRDQVNAVIFDCVEPSAYVQEFSAFFNTRFEFYGRTVNFRCGPASGSNNDETERAAAADIDTKYGAFAAGQKYEDAVFYEELARRHIIGVPRDGTFSDAAHTQFAPYLWSYVMSADRVFGMLGDMACSQLAGRPPSHSGISAPKRVFGLWTMERPNRGGESRPMVAALERELDVCGERLADKVVFPQNEWSSQAANAWARFKFAGVTTVFLQGNNGQLMNAQRVASAQNYFPEWVVSSYIQTDQSILARGTGAADQMQHMFGLTVRPREVPTANHPAWWARKEANPNQTAPAGAANEIHYRSMLLISSGIQMAGPRLTPETFAQGLHQARFPNPYHTNMAGAVGFEDGDYSMTNDAAGIWWSNTDPGVMNGDGVGRFCYVEGGRRFKSGGFPKGTDSFFQPPCERPTPAQEG